jgi:hypothetical protein
MRAKVLGGLLLSLALTAGCGGSGPTGVDAGPDANANVDAATGDPDAADLVPCDPVTQQGCIGTQKCAIVPSPVLGDPPRIGCVEGVGNVGSMEPCTPATPEQPDDCAPGLSCRGDVAPLCLEFCSDYPEDTCSQGEICAFGEDFDGDWVADVLFCAVTCDVLAQDCAGASISCYPTSSGTICAPEGAGGTPVQEGDACAYANSCAEGLGCFQVGASFDFLCFKVCDPCDGCEPSCGPAQTCSQVQDEVWGICIDDV